MEKTWADVLADDRAAREAPPGTPIELWDNDTKQWVYTSSRPRVFYRYHLYRIKPEPQLRPYTTGEWMAYCDGWFRQKGGVSSYKPHRITFNTLWINGAPVSPLEAIASYDHYDPATGETRPCGVEE